MKKLIAIALAGTALSSGAYAGGYVAGSIGPSHASYDCSGTTSCDNSGTGFKLIGGYDLNSNLSAEVSYLSFGKATATIVDPTFGTVAADIKVNGLAVGVAFHGDLTPQVVGTVRLGLADLKTKVSVTSGSLSGSDSETHAKPYFGLGVGYRVTPALSIDASADFSRSEYAGESASVRLVSVGATWRF